ncbi:uncharacterized protein C5orf49 isoform X2 [Exaiptasia diaphana]|uniref:Uncharacterized protein n=1 Tax=Exaiptasia diaphana TaxID=2652724 RepID=A0A913XC63_EXADI|nr:uncharacterized protein C5orf49 isoform X2 [Exaiptasia diaphana]KXJ13452.1 Uncharacterized protein C5orf49 [Exaiptasia diaphana]
MAELVKGFNFSYYPSETEVDDARNSLRPIGILSKAYDQHQLIKHKREESIRTNHIVTKGGENVSSSWKIKKPEPIDITQDTSYFKAKTLHDRPSTYDRINRVVLGYDQKLHRDDREHAKSRGLRVNSEESVLPVPSLSSSVYGHPNRKPLEFPDRKHVRVELCKKDFLRLNGTNISTNDPNYQ